jgi:hypothetical protein
MRHRTRLVAAILGVAVMGSAGAASAVIQVPGDHYLCYKVAVAKFPSQTIPKPVATGVSLADQFETRIYDAAKITVVCNPGTKTHNSESFPPADQNVHFVGYQVKLSKTPLQKEDTAYPKVNRNVFNQFAAADMGVTHNLAATKPDSVLVQSLKYDNGTTTKCSAASDPCPALGKVCDAAAKVCLPSPLPTLGTAPDPGTSGVNNYKCYKIKDNKNPAFAAIPQVQWSDQFGSRVLLITKPTKLCTPVDKQGDGIADSDVHLTCYQAKLAALPVPQPKFLARKVLTKNANFGNAWLDAKSIAELCVPSYKGAIPGSPVFLDFTTGPPNLSSCVCGNSFNATTGGSTIKDLHCGGLNVGGGPSTVAEGATPENATTRFVVTGCAGSACTLGPTTAAGPGFDCSNTGCFFGPPLPIPNSGTSTCVINTFSAPGGGTVDTATGASSTVVPLDSHVFLTGNAAAPCPRCVGGLCDRGPNGPNGDCTASGVPHACCTGNRQGSGTGLCAPDPCTTSNAAMTTHQCASDGSDLGTIAVDLTPLTTALAMRNDSGNAPGVMCPGQDSPTNPAVGSKAGCFGSDLCRRIESQGIPSAPLVLNGPPQAARLASVFCIPETPGGTGQIINLAAGLPGPGQTCLPGQVSIHN